jgi:pilus assembly protein CpaF
MTSAAEIIANRVRDRVRRVGVDLAGDGLAERFVQEEVRRYSERALGSTLPLLSDESVTEREVVASLTGFGPLQPYLDDPDIEEIWINSPDGYLAA